METYDCAIVGAGPAGCCAALRLAALGHRVVLLERAAFPRPHVGESLSPGVGNILDFLGVSTAQEAAGYLSELPGQIIWEQAEAQPLPAGRFSLIVNRARLDAWLLAQAKARGVDVLQPARLLACDDRPDHLVLQIRQGENQRTLATRWLLDASGRNGLKPRHPLTLAPSTFALCASVTGLPRKTRIEALPTAWVWGAPHPDGSHRVMAFVDASKPGQGSPSARLAEVLGQSRLFEAAQLVTPAFTRPATAYFDRQAWQAQRLKLGDAAFTLDPLSSTGVETAMRLALQAAIAINTVLHDPNAASVAQAFYEQRLAETAAQHRRWSAEYYSQAHCAEGNPFWQARSRPENMVEAEMPKHLLTALSGHPPLAAEPSPKPRIAWTGPLVLCPKACAISTPCVIGDRIRLLQALSHPELQRPVAFLGGIELVPLLETVHGHMWPEELVSLWALAMPKLKASNIVDWLIQHRLLVMSNGSNAFHG
jgi:flavin-dependent dehydrogenase